MAYGGTLSISRRIQRAGYRSYSDYLRSDHWADVKRRYRASKLNKGRCHSCREKKPCDLHHRTYKRLGEERLTDLFLLCRDCHSELHRLVRESGEENAGFALWRGTKTLRQSRRRIRT
jgi:5-methylcytosine-specific restriction endonuclease McrA